MMIKCPICGNKYDNLYGLCIKCGGKTGAALDTLLEAHTRKLLAKKLRNAADIADEYRAWVDWLDYIDTKMVPPVFPTIAYCMRSSERDYLLSVQSDLEADNQYV